METITQGDVLVTTPKSLVDLEKSSPTSALNKLESGGCLTREGKNWFILATDPFHDERLALSGYPDTNVSGSVIQCVKQSIEIPVPSDLAGANWDLHITNFPIFNVESDSRPLFSNMVQTGPAQNTFGVSGLTPLYGAYVGANAGASGQPIWSDTAGNAVPAAYIALDSDYTSGVSRVIGMGFEVTNTTAPLYMQGQVTCYRQPMPVPNQRGVELINNTEGTLSGYADIYRSRCPPKTLAECMLLEGSSTWEASKGCYVVSTLNQLENPAVQPMAVGFGLDLQDQFIGTGGFPTNFYVGNNLGILEAPITGDDNYGIAERSLILPYNMAGAYFTGLSTQTTLQLTVKYFIERFPDPSNTNLVVLATPSASFDPCALELYARTITQMPVGVPQGENSLGDWFKGIANKVASFATPILKTFAPLHPLIGGAAVLSSGVKALTSGNDRKAARRIQDVQFLSEGNLERRERRRTNRARKRQLRNTMDGSRGGSARAYPVYRD